MRILTTTSLAAIVASALLAAGCGGTGAQPTAPPSGANATPPPATGPTTAPMADMPADKDMTHVLTAPEPYYVDAPNASSVPAGTLPAGTKVLMVVPGTPYCKVISDQGKSCYTLTSGLKPLSDK